VPVVSYFQSWAPVTASSEYTPFAALKYITLSITSGVLSKNPDLSPVWNVHARLRSFTLDVLICASVENLVPPGSCPNDAQLFWPSRRDDHIATTAITTTHSFFMKTVSARRRSSPSSDAV
jgi:hypothetical protein